MAEGGGGETLSKSRGRVHPLLQESLRCAAAVASHFLQRATEECEKRNGGGKGR